MPENPVHAQIYKGISRHYDADRLFHQSEFFQHYSNLIHSRIKVSRLPSLHFRSYFLAHVFLELLLDRLLVKHNAQLCVEFYRDLESVNPLAAASYFSRIGKAGVFTEFFDNFNRFLYYRFLLFLGDNEMFVKALLRAYHKIIPVAVSRKESEILMALTDEIESEHRHHLLDIFDTMSNPEPIT